MGFEQQALFLLVRMQICHFRCFRQTKKNSFWQDKNRRESSGGMEWLGVWNCIFRALTFLISEPEIWQKIALSGISGIFLKNSASEKYFSDSGK